MRIIFKNKLKYLTLVFLFISFFHSSAFSQDSLKCSVQLDSAEKEYQMGEWDNAINLINDCLKKKDISEAEKGRAYRILGLVYIAIQLEKEANDAVKNLLIMVPNYKIDPEKDPPQLKTLIDNVSRKLNPAVTSINPSSAEQEGDNFTMTVNGSNFVNGAVVRFNGQDMTTYYISSTELKADIPSDALSTAGDKDVYVFNPILEGKSSDAVMFSITAASGFPWTWIAIGGGAVAAVIVAVIALGGSDEEEVPVSSLANPPGRP